MMAPIASPPTSVPISNKLLLGDSPQHTTTNILSRRGEGRGCWLACNRVRKLSKTSIKTDHTRYTVYHFNNAPESTGKTSLS
jgi:hypothetical protein